MSEQQHQTYIVSDQPVTVHVTDTGHWFRMWRAIVRSGLLAELSPTATKVLLVLAESVNDDMRRDRGEWLAWPSIGTIMELAGVGRAITFRAIAELEQRGLLVRRQSGGGRKSTLYQLVEPSVTAGVYGRRPVHERRRQGSTGARATGLRAWTQQRKNDSERNDDSAAAELREAEGFARPDADRLAAAFGPAAVAQARRLADERERVKPLRSRRGFIVKALEESWTPAEPQARPRPKQQPAGVPAHPAAQSDDAAAAERREIEDQQRRVSELLARIDPATFDAEAARVLDAMPEATARLYRKLDPRKSASIRAAVAARVGEAGQGGRLAALLADA